MLSAEEQDRLREMEDWIIKNEGTWVLAEGFNTFLGKLQTTFEFSQTVESKLIDEVVRIEINLQVESFMTRRFQVKLESQCSSFLHSVRDKMILF